MEMRKLNDDKLYNFYCLFFFKFLVKGVLSLKDDLFL